MFVTEISKKKIEESCVKSHVSELPVFSGGNHVYYVHLQKEQLRICSI